MKSTDQIVMDRKTVAAAKPNGPATAAIKTILFHVHEDEGLETRLQAALSLARACSAHLHLLHVIPVEAFTVTDLYGGTFASGQIVEALEDEAAKLRARLEARLGREDVSWTYEVTTSAVVPELLKSAALSDLLVIGRQPRTREFTRTGPSLIGELACRARTPLCVPGDAADGLDPFGKAMIAWNGSVEAANAVRSSIGLLRMAAEVRVVRFVEEKDRLFPDTRLLDYLSRHGVKAEHQTLAPQKDDAAGLIEQGERSGAGYLVIGAYSHNRAGEFLFGGVTRALLRACPLTLVMAH